ncbi:hypothetical protein [Burkholderia sp. Ac-20379]|uniref:hypothetical protein n=1 Tax=Burkholderia sp. Ac-20379 TaxID=2703900 RepID=UPI0019822C01|nr:hypothetical protein [Burkholderia sp. Ac-20379]MBN3723150.1 hypothetical protein [Burkholderia sp. Ac-20379]
MPRHASHPLDGPLPAREQRDLQLKHHLAFARLRDDGRDPAPLAVLANVVRLAAALGGNADPDAAQLAAAAEAALERTYLRGAPYRLDEAGRDVLAALLALHDAQLAAATVGHYLDAWRAVRRINAERASAAAIVAPATLKRKTLATA